MLTIHWKSLLTGAIGHGEPIHAEIARLWVAKLNREWPDLDHWTE